MKKNSRNNAVRVLNIILSMGLGVCAALVSPVIRNIRNLTLGQYIAGIVLLMFELYLAFFLQIIVHEGGHLVFGLLSGYSFSSFRILSFMLVKKEGKLQFKKFRLSGTMGQCLMSPPEMQDGRIPYILYNLGGVIMNLLCSALCALTAVFTERSGTDASFLWIMVLAGIYMALTNGIPLNATVPNDGHNAMSLGRDPYALRSFWVQLATNAASAQGIRLKDMPAEWFEIPEGADMSNAIISSWGVLAQNRAMDKHDFAAARRLLEMLLGDGCEPSELMRVLMLNDKAYLDMLDSGRDADLSALEEKKTASILKQMGNFPSVVRTQYAEALLMKEDKEEAEKIIGRFERIALTYPSDSDIEAERELMDIAREKAGSTT